MGTTVRGCTRGQVCPVKVPQCPDNHILELSGAQGSGGHFQP